MVNCFDYEYAEKEINRVAKRLGNFECFDGVFTSMCINKYLLQKNLLQKKGIRYFYDNKNRENRFFEYKKIIIRDSDNFAKQVFIKDGDKEFLAFTLPVFGEKVVINQTHDIYTFAFAFEYFITALDEILDIYMELGIFEKDDDYFIRKGFDDHYCCNVCCKCTCNEKKKKMR